MTATSRVASTDQTKAAGRGPVRGAVTLRGVAHSYRAADGRVLDGIDLDAAPGEILTLIGRSGSGKSTLLHVAAGMLRPSAGTVTIDGAPVQRPDPRWVMMFQAPSLFPWMTVTQNAGLALRYAGRGSSAPARVARTLELVDLTEFAGRNVQDLSGGQQQRVALARSLVPEPDILLLDEPFSALDLFTRRALQRDVRRISREFGLTVILVTHDIGEAVTMADRAVFLSGGRIAADTPVARGAEDAPNGREEARLAAIYAEISNQPAETGPSQP